MSHIRVTARFALWSLAALASSAAAQTGRRNQGQAPQQTTVRTEQELKISIELPAPPTAQCEATVSSDYQQRNTVARVESAITVKACAAAAGKFKVTLRTRDDSGAVQTLEFDEAWQRSDDKDVSITADYPIGANVELVSARVRGLSCTCAEPPGDPLVDPPGENPPTPALD